MSHTMTKRYHILLSVYSLHPENIWLQLSLHLRRDLNSQQYLVCRMMMLHRLKKKLRIRLHIRWVVTGVLLYSNTKSLHKISRCIISWIVFSSTFFCT